MPACSTSATLLRAAAGRHVQQLVGGLPGHHVHGHRRASDDRRRGGQHGGLRRRRAADGPALQEPYACTFFPEPFDPHIEITGAGAGPIVVCGATGDAATPLEGTRRMAETLEDGRLIIIDADQHTCYPADPCADALIDEYLVDLVAPPEVTEC